MLIGLISDTHDNISAIEEAVRRFNERNVGLVLHSGDYNSPFTAKFFKPLKCRLIGVFGNIDGERELLRARYSEIGAEIRGDFTEIEVNGLKIALLHGIHQPIIIALAKSGNYNVVIHGHTHNQRYEKVYETFIINPGEACGYLTGRRSIAILNTETLNVDFITI
ncbi:MAG: metallophosphoesterase [Nitrososphaerota archaeon]|nr:metallophosphoesterase [Nitrososphaerales archaeon]MCX8191559.1 metallophosphoesterase [Nitrososphaerales archaeon]MDW8044412.1 metallophosphoesterase [Nitrososphaerota archaeon]